MKTSYLIKLFQFLSFSQTDPLITPVPFSCIMQSFKTSKIAHVLSHSSRSIKARLSTVQLTLRFSKIIVLFIYVLQQINTSKINMISNQHGHSPEGG